MKLIVVSGRSGSGKSTALHALEDQGYHCIDNLPVGLLPTLAERLRDEAPDMPVAVVIDARNLPRELESFPEILERLRTDALYAVEVIFLDAEPDTLVRRFSETRRRHPLTDSEHHLSEALEAEADVLAALRDQADLRIDTTRMTIHALRAEIRGRVVARGEDRLSLQFRSFGFRGGVPVDADTVFDVRCLANPHWIPELRALTGRDADVATWLQDHDDVAAMEADIRTWLERWLPAFVREGRSYMTVAIGCTGGQHRSVFLAERLAQHFGSGAFNVLVRHRELDG